MTPRQQQTLLCVLQWREKLLLMKRVSSIIFGFPFSGLTLFAENPCSLDDLFTAFTIEGIYAPSTDLLDIKGPKFEFGYHEST
jgi:hypothetical protein